MTPSNKALGDITSILEKYLSRIDTSLQRIAEALETQQTKSAENTESIETQSRFSIFIHSEIDNNECIWAGFLLFSPENKLLARHIEKSGKRYDETYYRLRLLYSALGSPVFTGNHQPINVFVDSSIIYLYLYGLSTYNNIAKQNIVDDIKKRQDLAGMLDVKQLTADQPIMNKLKLQILDKINEEKNRCSQ